MDTHTYTICVQGYLDEHRLRQFADVTIDHTPDGATIITATHLDQAALYALISRLRDLGLELLALRAVPPPVDPDDERLNP